MNITVPPTEGELNVSAIKHAIRRKEDEVQKASRVLDELRAELRGLNAALTAINPKEK